MGDNRKILNAANKMVKRDEKAFEIVYDYFYPMVKYIAGKYVKDKDGIDDVINQTFTNVYLNAKHFDELTKFRNWLFTITKNVAINFAKQESKYVYTLDENGLVDVTSISPDEIHLVKEYLDHLTDLEREIVNARLFENEKYIELSKKFGFSVGFIHKIYQNALSKMRQVAIENGITLKV